MLQLTFQLNPHTKTPLYEQLYAAIATQIRTGKLTPNTRLPGKRSLAAELSVSVSTVDTAYQILTAEGYLESHTRSGFFVQEYNEKTPFYTGAHHQPLPQTATVNSAMPNHNTAATQTPPCPLNHTEQTGTKQAPVPPIRFDLSGTGIDPALFPFRTWGRIQKELLYTAPELLLRGAPQGDENLRTALAEYFAAFRGVHCDASQIVVGAGVEYLLSLLAPLLPKDGGVENPGYPRAKAVLENSDCTCTYLPLDEKGLSVDALRKSGANFCYVTPSHQYPTGVTMPVGRRAELLHWASEAPIVFGDIANKAAPTLTQPTRYIIEDDYDSEFRFDIRPLPSLQGMAGAAGTVVYLATFSKSLAPSIRIAAMVLPQPLLQAWQMRYGSYASTVSRFDQQTLCRFLTEGYFTRHLARARGIYKARRNALVRALEDAFGKENIRLTGLHTGLHLLFCWQGITHCCNEQQMVSRCAALGVRVTPLSASYAEGTAPCPAQTILLGYAALQEQDAAAVAALLANALAPDGGIE